VPNMARTAILALLLLVVLLPTACRPSSPTTPTPSPTPIPVFQGSAGDMTIIVRLIINPYNPERSEVAAPRGFQLVRFILSLENKGSEPMPVSALDFILEDQQGSFYYGQGSFEAPLGLIYTLAPGASVQATVTFTVAQGRALDRLKYVISSPTPQIVSLSLRNP
jgi:hypothetical protein